MEEAITRDEVRMFMFDQPHIRRKAAYFWNIEIAMGYVDETTPIIAPQSFLSARLGMKPRTVREAKAQALQDGFWKASGGHGNVPAQYLPTEKLINAVKAKREGAK